MLKSLRTEDWVSTIIGAIILALVILLHGVQLNGAPVMRNEIVLFFVIGVLTYLGYLFMGNKDKKGGYFISFIAIFALAWVSGWLSNLTLVREVTICDLTGAETITNRETIGSLLGLESVLFAVTIGLIIRNTIGLPKFMADAVKSEYFIKAGLVVLGSSILFSEVMRAGALGMIQGIAVVLSVWYFSFWLSTKIFKIDQEMSALLSSAVSICGVSAAIATNGAIKGDPKKLSFVISLVLIVAIPMMYVMPYVAVWIGLTPEVAGAWIGGTIDTTAAVVAAGALHGPAAEQVAVIVKSSQNALLGGAALIISIYWSYRGTSDEQLRPSGAVIWERFPKFVLGFLLASLVFSLFFDEQTGRELARAANGGARSMLFSLAFVCIGLETDFRYIFKKENAKYIWSFLVAQGFNIVITLVLAFFLFRNFILG